MKPLTFLLALLISTAAMASDAGLPLRLRSQHETVPGSGRFHRTERPETWKPTETAVIVCDMWDLHHCLNAVRREAEFAPRLNLMLKQLREQGVTIIHAPSDCMDFYRDHPARRRAIETPQASQLPEGIGQWCHQIPAEEKAEYPIDQSDGGEDDDPQEHAEWAAELQAKGLDPRRPWTRQTSDIEIDPQRDYISDRGEEVWSILESRGLKNVMLTGVHTNMCVLGRPFGLRQMAKNGRNVVLVRDLTDTMYNPLASPYVSHFTGTDLIVSHIERYVCPTIVSSQVLGGEPFRFSGDTRPHVVMVIAEDEYETATTLLKFAKEHLGKDFRVSFVYADEENPNSLEGAEVISEADVLLLSVRRRPLPSRQLKLIREHISSGKPVVGIRTSSHAFHLRNKEAPAGLEDWPDFDAAVFGGNYSNHYGNQLKSTVTFAEGAADHPILDGVPGKFSQGGSLYKTAPLAEGAEPLLVGTLNEEEVDPEPIAWLFTRADGGRSFYTSLGHRQDFAGDALPRLLLNALRYVARQTPAAR